MIIPFNLRFSRKFDRDLAKCGIVGGDGLIFGDGTEAGNLYVEVLPAARLDIESGFLVDMNV